MCITAGLQRRHQGVLIPVQITATSRRRKGVPRGRRPIPQGHPPKLSTVGKSNKELSMKKFKPRNSRLKNGNSVTTLWLTCFDDLFHFLGSFNENLAPRSLPKVPACFAMVGNLKLLLTIPKIRVCYIQ